ncbi:hypothetical protein SKC37_04930 [Aquirufa sp. HETE-83D]|uniref:Slp family lipoprotein n=1 Tax=Aquirufa esocilacus TaxID=3096513 RepID=A0ABW6DKF7_9BACT
MRIITLFAFLGLFSCARQSASPVVVDQNVQKEKRLQVKLQSLNVVKTQEVLGDELVLVGAIGIMEGDTIKPIQVFSTYLGRVKSGQVIRLDTIKPVEVRLKSGQKASFQLSLFEIEDYQPTKKWVNRFNAVSGVLAIPLALTSAENPVSWFLWGMKAGSLGLDWVSEIDKRDLVGVSETQWDYDSVLSTERTGKWIGGRRLIDAYEYQYKIQINVE